MDVIQERGQAIVFAGFWVIMLSVLLRYARIRKGIAIQVGPGSARISGRSELFQSLLEEGLDNLAEKLK